MVRSLTTVAALAAAMVSSGCTALSVRGALDKEDLARIHSVGVASTLGDTLHGVSMGTTIYSSESFHALVTDWQMDAYAASRAVALLDEAKRVKAQALSVSGDSVDAQRKVALEDAARKGLDAVVLLHPGVSDVYKGVTPGYGFLERSTLGVLSSRCVYAAYQVEVIDVKSRKTLAWQWGGVSPCDEGADNDLPYRKAFAEYSSDEKQAIHQRMDALVVKGVKYSLQQLDLLPGGNVLR